MTSLQQCAELHRQIRAIANDVRGSVDGWNFKQYILVRFFTALSVKTSLITSKPVTIVSTMLRSTTALSLMTLKKIQSKPSVISSKVMPWRKSIAYNVFLDK